MTWNTVNDWLGLDLNAWLLLLRLGFLYDMIEINKITTLNSTKEE